MEEHRHKKLLDMSVPVLSLAKECHSPQTLPLSQPRRPTSAGSNATSSSRRASPVRNGILSSPTDRRSRGRGLSHLALAHSPWHHSGRQYQAMCTGLYIVYPTLSECCTTTPSCWVPVRIRIPQRLDPESVPNSGDHRQRVLSDHHRRGLGLCDARDAGSRGRIILNTGEGMMSQYPLGFGQSLQALAYALSKPREIAIMGDPESADTQALLNVARDGYQPFQVVALGVPDRGASTVPLLDERDLVDGQPAANLCRDFVCQAPISEPEGLQAQLKQR